MQSNHVLSSRRGRIALIFGSLTALLLVFATLGRPSSNLASRLRTFSNHDRLPSPSPSQSQDVVTDSDGVPVQWSDFAYVQYVTNPNYLCNSLMIFEALRRHETKAELLMMYPHQWEIAADGNYESKLLAQTQNMYNVQMKPIQVRTYTNVGDPTWQDSYTKLLAFNQTQYKRVISLDSDATVLNVRMYSSMYRRTYCSLNLAYGRTLSASISSCGHASSILGIRHFPFFTTHRYRAFPTRIPTH